MDRVGWLLLALVLLLAALYLHVHLLGEWIASLAAGIGAGIALALLGSVIHDAFAGTQSRR